MISIVIPAYKQEKTILEDLKRIHSVLSQTRWDFEIIVVVDGSVDKTEKEAKKLKKDNVFVYSYENNHGKGYAVRYGMARSKGDPVLFIDAGMEIDPVGIGIMLEHMEWYDADIMVGSKWHLASKVKWGKFRKLYSKGYHTITKLLFGLQVNDTQSGLKAFRKKVLEKTLPRLLIKRFAFDVELLAVANSLGFTRIYECPISLDFTKAVSSNFKEGFIFFNPHIRHMLIDTIAVFYRLKILQYYSDANKRKWRYDKELEMRVNI